MPPRPSLGAAPLRAVVFDLDGTLYRQGPLRRAMLGRLLAAHALRPVTGWRTLRALGAYRRAQEHLRAQGAAAPIAVGAAQLAEACRRSGAAPAFVEACVARWMEREPLPLLARHLHPGLRELLQACRQRGLRLGLFSDYPPEAKLAALGLAEAFDAVLWAGSPGVGALKPDPRGLLAVLARLGADPGESVYVGDRVEVDGAAAARAGLACAILTRRPPPPDGGFTPFTRYAELDALLRGGEARPPLHATTGSP